MSGLDIVTPSRAQTVIDGLYRDVERHLPPAPPGLCPVDLAMNFLNLCHAQTCGKCVPCRVGLGQLSDLMERRARRQGDDGDHRAHRAHGARDRQQRGLRHRARCGAAGARRHPGLPRRLEEHVLRHRCLGRMQNPVPLRGAVPCGVDIPGYVLVKYGRYADAVRLIRQDNPPSPPPARTSASILARRAAAAT